MPGRLEGKIALVSGSTQGFGRGILETFVREGATVLGMDLQATDGPVDGYTEHQAYQIKANVAEEESWKNALETCIAKFGNAPSIVVHNAGWSYPNKSGLDVTIEEFDRLFNVNVRSIYLASKILVPEMKKNGPGSTVVISSENAIRPGATQTWYNATKAGVSSATKSMALEFARDQLRFNTICPTSGNTPLLNKFAGIADGPVPAEIIKAKCDAIPIGRLVEPSDVANVALFLAEPASSIISGVEILVDGARCV
ncbi:NAD(P)-binding protein [Aspergillus californicus]